MSIGSKWVQIGQHGENEWKWVLMGKQNPKWVNICHNGSKLVIMGQNGLNRINWVKLSLIRSTVVKITYNRLKWVKNS